MHDAIQDPWGPATPIGRGADWPERVDVHLADGVAADDVERWVPSASLLHSNGDAMDIAVSGGRIVGVRGRARTASTTAGWARRTSSVGRPTPRPTA